MSSSIALTHLRQIARTGHPAALVGFWLCATLVCLALWLGWSQREQAYLEAESGLGYALGIVGGVMMLVLLLYPLRKRIRFMSNWSTVRIWFQVHMVCGAFGPVLILYHSNFSLGSTNSTVALFSMLVVAASGLVGRYIVHRIGYRKVERQERLQAFLEHPDQELRTLEPLLEAMPQLRSDLDEYSRRSARGRAGVVRDVIWLIRADVRSRSLEREGRRLVESALATVAKRRDWTAAQTRKVRERALDDLHRYVKVAREANEYACLQHLFARWHHLHLPLFTMMVVTGITHVFAVHLY